MQWPRHLQVHWQPAQRDDVRVQHPLRRPRLLGLQHTVPVRRGTSACRAFCVTNSGCLAASNLNGSTDCSYCAEGYFGNDPSPGEALVCSPCPFCPGHGVCDGSGTTKGSYTCHCVDGYEGATCSSTPTNWLIVGPILGGVGLLLGLCIGWRVCVCRRQAKAERLHQLKQALLQQEQQEERKRRKKEKKRAKKQRKREERQRRRRKKKRRARQGASGNPGERLPPSTASVDDDGGDGSSSDDNDDGGDVAVEMNGSNGQLGAVPGPVTGGWETTNSGTGYYVPPQPRIVHNEALADNAVV